MEDWSKIIGFKTKKIRISFEDTREQLAKELNTTVNTIERIELGRRNTIPLEYIRAFCEYYGVSADDLLEIRKGRR